MTIQSIKTDFVTIEATETTEGDVKLKIAAHGKGKLVKAKLGVMPPPLRLNLKEGMSLSLTLEREK